MTTTLYLIRHARAEAAAAGDPRPDPGLSRLGRKQAALTRDLLAVWSIDACYHASSRRAAETAAILADPHGLEPVPLEIAGPAATFEALLARHPGEGVVVVASRLVLVGYLARLLGLPAGADLPHDPCGISIVVGDAAGPRVVTLNSAFHLRGSTATTRPQPLAA